MRESDEVLRRSMLITRRGDIRLPESQVSTDLGVFFSLSLSPSLPLSLSLSRRCEVYMEIHDADSRSNSSKDLSCVCTSEDAGVGRGIDKRTAFVA